MEATFDRIYRLRQVVQLTGLSRSTIYALVARGQFPAPIRLTERTVGWRQSALTRWIEERAQVTPQP